MMIALGSLIVSFGLYNIHNQFSITEGGILGAMLLIHHWTGVPVSLISLVLDLICYAIAFKSLGYEFIKKSVVATCLMTLFLALFERFPPIIPQSIGNPFLIAILGGLFVGLGVGIVIRYGGSCGGDDALALIISKKTGYPLKFSYLITDISILILSLSYIPFSKIQYSMLTVTVSSVIIDWVNTYKKGEN